MMSNEDSGCERRLSNRLLQLGLGGGAAIVAAKVCTHNPSGISASTLDIALETLPVVGLVVAASLWLRRPARGTNNKLATRLRALIALCVILVCCDGARWLWSFANGPVLNVSASLIHSEDAGLSLPIAGGWKPTGQTRGAKASLAHKNPRTSFYLYLIRFDEHASLDSLLEPSRWDDNIRGTMRDIIQTDDRIAEHTGRRLAFSVDRQEGTARMRAQAFRAGKYAIVMFCVSTEKDFTAAELSCDRLVEGLELAP